MANTGHTLICNNAMAHFNVSGPNNAKANYENWGYRGHCSVTMAPSWLSRDVCMCVCSLSPWVYFPPTDAIPKTPYPTVSVVRPHYRGCCRSEGQGSRQRISSINTPQADQSTWIFVSTNKMLASIKTKEWEGKERQKELGGVRKRRM